MADSTNGNNAMEAEAGASREGADAHAAGAGREAGGSVDAHDAPDAPDAQETESLRERIEERGHEQASVGGHTMDKANIFKFVGLVAFLVLMAVIVVVAWPYIADVFTEGGVERLVERVQNAGPLGVLILLGMQFLQIVVAFIPGEVVQVAAGLMYGPWLGALIVLVGCVISSSVVYKLVHALGAPFVQGMVSTEHLEKFHSFEESGKLDVIVFVLFLIPAMPKDVFTYIVPLTNMKYGKFITLTTIGRIPGVLASTYAASGLASGEIVGPIVVVAVVAVIAVVVVLFRDKIMDVLGKGRG